MMTTLDFPISSAFFLIEERSITPKWRGSPSTSQIFNIFLSLVIKCDLGGEKEQRKNMTKSSQSPRNGGG